MQHPGLKMKNEKIKKHNIHNYDNKINVKKFIPNTTIINSKSEGARAILLTGPNMGGKSTLLRQTCLAVILAQLGCYVPAERVAMTPTDRIFTRLGASDRILEGKSTFYVEMEETKNIMAFGTKRSLAIIDELGRGTSTFDGYSIANAVLKYLVENIKCRSLFATHYHMLLDDFRDVPGVSSYHMKCVVDPKNAEKIRFLYKFVKGECPKSFGMNVAMMSGLNKNIIANAIKISDNFNTRMLRLSELVKEKMKKPVESTEENLSGDEEMKIIEKPKILGTFTNEDKSLKGSNPNDLKEVLQSDPALKGLMQRLISKPKVASSRVYRAAEFGDKAPIIIKVSADQINEL